MEATIGAAVRPEDKLLILANGAYGKRMAQIADYYHINYVLVSLHETELVTGEVARRALEEHPGITHLSMVHSETTTGLLNPIEEVAEVIKGRGITVYRGCDEQLWRCPYRRERFRYRLLGQ